MIQPVKSKMLLLLTFAIAIAGACSPVVLYTDETASEGPFCFKGVKEKQPLLYSILEKGKSWGTEKKLNLVVNWTKRFKSKTWSGNIHANLGNVEITDTEYGKMVFMEKMQEKYEEACKNGLMRRAILESAGCGNLSTIDHLLQSSILSSYPLLVELLQTLDTFFVKMDGLSHAVSAELCFGKASTCTNVDVVMKMLQHDHEFIKSAVNVCKLSELLVDYEPDLDTLRMVLSWGTDNVKDAYEWATPNLGKPTQALLTLKGQYQLRHALRLICFQELKSFPNLPNHLKSIKMNSSKLGREHLILMLLFPEQSEKLSLMVWDREKSLQTLFSILPLLPWQTELAMKLSWELYWNQSMFFKALKLATHKPRLNLAQTWFTNIFEKHIVRGNYLNEISSFWKCFLSQSVILHQLYLRSYAPQSFDSFILKKIRSYLPELGFVATNEKEILFDEVFLKEIGTDDSYVILLLRVLLTMVFDEKKLTRWIAAYLLTAEELPASQPVMIELILDGELAGPNCEIWLEMVSTTLRLFVPDFVFDDAPYTSVIGLAASIRRQINLPRSIGLIRILKQQNDILATNSFIPIISSKILAEIGGISNARVVKQMLTKLLRQTQLLDIEGSHQNSSEILDNLYSRIDQYSFLRPFIWSPPDANLDPLRVDEIIKSILKSHGNSFIQTAMALATFKDGDYDCERHKKCHWL